MFYKGVISIASNFPLQCRGGSIGVIANIMYLSINASQRLEICEAAFDGLFDQKAFTDFTVTEVKTQVLGKYFSNKTSSLF